MESCLEVPRAICLASSSGGVVVAPLATPRNLALWYQFDKSLPVDDSGNGHHLRSAEGALVALPVGPGVLGRGASAAFDGRLLAGLRGAEAAPSGPRGEATVALWIYLQEDSHGSWRTIFSRGNDPEQMTLALMLGPDERRLRAVASPRGRGGQPASLDGTGLLPLRRWTHVAVAFAGGVLRLYVNGLRDSEVVLDEAGGAAGAEAEAWGDLHLGRDPWRAGVKAYLDDFRWYDRALAVSEIRALTYPSLTGMGSDFVRLGCVGCRFTDAVRSCGSRSHLCTQEELLSGGLQAARAAGWLAASPEVWFHGVNESERFADAAKLGLCCSD